MKRLLIAISMLVAAAACSTPTPKAAPSPSTRPLSDVRTKEGFPLWRDPDTSAGVADPGFHVGQRVFITDKGFVPVQLVSVVDTPVEFVNETSKPVNIAFLTGAYTLAEIAPSGRASFTPNASVSIRYHLSGAPQVAAGIQVEPYLQPNEPPPVANK